MVINNLAMIGSGIVFSIVLIFILMVQGSIEKNICDQDSNSEACKIAQKGTQGVANIVDFSNKFDPTLIIIVGSIIGGIIGTIIYFGRKGGE